jgi:hypothetical protein
MREPLPVSTWYALEQREWRIASTKHANSYLFRVDRGEAGGPGSGHLHPRDGRGLLRGLGSVGSMGSVIRLAASTRQVANDTARSTHSPLMTQYH